MAEAPELIIPDWPAPARVRAAMTTRVGEFSQIAQELQLPSEPNWLEQVHGAAVVEIPSPRSRAERRGEGQGPVADASFTTAPGVVCVARSADCLPVLFCNDAGTVVAAAHAGWRGLCKGVLEATVRAMPEKPAALMAWLGAAIGPKSFEVGAEVRQAFMAVDRDAAQHFHPRTVPGKYLGDLYGLARQRLARLGISRVSGGEFDTYANPARFFSYRRDGSTGRMLALVWIDAKR